MSARRKKINAVVAVHLNRDFGHHLPDKFYHEDGKKFMLVRNILMQRSTHSVILFTPLKRGVTDIIPLRCIPAIVQAL